MGFVPADAPRLAIVVTVDEPTQGSRYGGIVAAPAFAEIASASLHYLGVAPTVEDPDAEAGRLALAEPEAEANPDTVLAWTGEGWRMPDLRGRPMRQALTSLQNTGLAVSIRGSGIVAQMEPAPGTQIMPGQPVQLTLR
jgi:cell division protein FtsI (penicillin-binding protein 3)